MLKAGGEEEEGRGGKDTGFKMRSRMMMMRR